MTTTTPDQNLARFADEHQLAGLSLPALRSIAGAEPGYTVRKAQQFLRFQQRLRSELLTHRIITANRYTAWFRQGQQNDAEIKAFIVQFSVFSNLFLVAQLLKMINADSLEAMRASKEILANEIGVVFNGSRPTGNAADREREGDPDLVGTTGSIEGGVFRFRAAHFEWLLAIAEKLGLRFQEVGHRSNGTQATLFFCDELARLYGSADYDTAQAASYAVENWAAAGFWDELIEGLTLFNQRSGRQLPLAFFTWHSRIEGQHARHTQEELEEIYFTHDLDENRFILDGRCMLDAVAAFWDGLDQQRPSLALRPPARVH